MEKLGALIAEGDGATIRWYFDQQIGGPRANITYDIVLTNRDVLEACAKVIVKYLSADDHEQAIQDLMAELQTL